LRVWLGEDDSRISLSIEPTSGIDDFEGHAFDDAGAALLE
jgi:hypothetical protein